MRTEVCHIRLTEEEMSQLEKKAGAAGLTKSGFIRSIINDGKPANKPEPANKPKPAKKVIKTTADAKKVISSWKPNPKLSKSYQAR